MAYSTRTAHRYEPRDVFAPRREANTSNDLLTVDFSYFNEGIGIQSSLNDDATGGYRGYFYIDGLNRVDYTSIERFNITGTDYADTIQVGNGDDVVRAGGGNDLVIAGYGSDTLDGGAGIDGLNKSFVTSRSGVSVNLTTDTITAAQGSIRNFEYFSNVIGSTRNDVFVSSQLRGDDIVSGGDGNDRAEFRIGSDRFSGGAGDDTLKADLSWYAGNEGISTSLSAESSGLGFRGYFYANNGARADFDTVENFEVTGTKNNDQIFTGKGNDILSGGLGNDDIRSGAGTDALDGGAGIDGVGRDFGLLTTGVTIDLAAGTLTGTTGSIVNFEYFSNVTGGEGADVFRGTTAIANDIIGGGAGDDTATFFAGYDTFNGGSNIDRAIIDYSARNVNAGIQTALNVDANGGYSGYMLIDNASRLDFASVEAFTVTGTAFDDRITTGNGDDTIRAGAGFDIVVAGGGSDTLDGGSGLDGVGRNFINTTANITVNLGAGTVRGIGGSITNFEYFAGFTSGSGNDVLITTAAFANDIVVMGGGNDSFTTYAGADVFTAGVNRDRLIMDYSALDVGAGINSTSQTADANGGYQGYFYISNQHRIDYTSVEEFTLTGTRYNDTLLGKEGDDILTGGAGNDLLYAGSGVDVVDGGEGVDGLGKDMSSLRTNLVVDLTTSKLTGATGSSITGMEYLADVRGGSGNDRFVTLKLQYNDLVYGGGGTDTASFFAGADRFEAGSGRDTLIIDYSAIDVDNGMSSSIQVDNDNGGFKGYYYLDGGRQVNFTGVETISVTGTKNNDQLAGGGGADALKGGDGRDTLAGGTGNDVLDGGDAADSIDGGADADTITGGSGSDTLTGGSEADRFVFAKGDSGAGLTYIDRIVDFATGIDTIDVSKIDADEGTAGNQAFTFVGNGAFTAAGQLHVVTIGGVTYVQGNVDSDTAAEFTIRVDATIPVEADFRL